MVRESKTKHEVVSEFRRATIVEAARGVFARKGFAAALVDDIAEESGIAKGTVYLYFKSKEEIYAAALLHDVETLCGLSTRSVEQAPDTRAKIVAFIAVRLRYFETNQDFFRIYISEFGNQLTRSRPIPEQLRAPYLQQLRMLESVIQSGVQRNEIRNVPADLAASAIYDLTRALTERRLLGWAQTSIDEDLEFLTGLLWRGLMPDAR